MRHNAYTALGFTVWHGGLWYYRRNYAPQVRRAAILAGAGAAALALAGGAGVAARRTRG